LAAAAPKKRNAGKAADSSPQLTAPADRPRLTKAELAVQSGMSAKDVNACIALGLLTAADAAETYDASNVTRLRLINALQYSGDRIAEFAAAIGEHGLTLDFVGSAVVEPVGLAAVTVKQALADMGITRDEFRRVMLALGFATPAPDEPIREDDIELLKIYVTVRELGLTESIILSTLRSFSISLRRLVDAQRDLFREHVEEPMLARGTPYNVMFDTVAKIRVPLQRIGYRATYVLQRRLVEQVVYENLIARIEEALNGQKQTKIARRQAILFVDLSGFTERTENLGDIQAASMGAALVDIAQAQAATHDGHLVKALGDGAMLHFAKAENAVRCAVEILAVARGAGLPPARAGIAVGSLIRQDGDYYGRTVNRAARLLGIAGPDQVLVTSEVPGIVHDTGFHFTDLGTVKLRGVNEEVFACAVTAG
jgi:adenylate cyclase